jgi:hypothetical protein
MRRSFITALAIFIAVAGICQDTTNILPTVTEDPKPTEKQPTYTFYAQKVVNVNTVQMIPKKKLEFKVSHNFDDAAGDFGGLKNFFGLDNALDIRIGFQYGLSNRFNIIAARYKGDTRVNRIYELGLKWLILQQMENDPQHPFSLAWYGNAAVATMKTGTNPELENFMSGFNERLSYMTELMIARKFGKGFSLQLNPVLIHRNFVVPHDQKTLFAVQGATRIHLGGRYSLLLDYSHTFRKQSSIDSLKVRNIKFYDAIGVGFEIMTEGHIFQLNFTNATDILENRYVARTVKTWGKGQFRWGFSIAREFDLFWKKKRNRK